MTTEQGLIFIFGKNIETIKNGYFEALQVNRALDNVTEEKVPNIQELRKATGEALKDIRKLIHEIQNPPSPFTYEYVKGLIPLFNSYFSFVNSVNKLKDKEELEADLATAVVGADEAQENDFIEMLKEAAVSLYVDPLKVIIRSRESTIKGKFSVLLK